LWKSSAVQSIIKEHFLFLQFNIQEHEGLNYRTFYPVEEFPHVAVLDPRTGERIKFWGGVSAGSGNFALNDPAEFVAQILELMDTISLNSHGPIGPAVKGKKPIGSLTEEEQLEKALQQSLEAMNTSKTPLKPKESGRSNEVASSNSGSEGNQLEKRIKALQPMDLPEPDAGGAGTTRIQYRLPNGSRLVRRVFENNSVADLYRIAKACVPEANTHEFELVVFRDNLSDKLDLSIEEAGLKNAAISLNYL
jgi:hypothetical protein